MARKEALMHAKSPNPDIKLFLDYFCFLLIPEIMLMSEIMSPCTLNNRPHILKEF